MRIPAFGLLSLLTTASHAAELAPLQSITHTLGGGASALTYFTAEPDGYHVVTTLQLDGSTGQAVARFTATLAPGQSTEVSIPQGPGRPASAITISREGSTMQVSQTATVANRE